MIGLWIDMLCHYVSLELHSCTIESFSTFICHAPANGQTYRWAPNEECLDGCPIRLLVEEFALLILCLRRPVMVNQFCWKNPWRKRCLNKQWVHLPKTMKREDRMRQVKKTVQLVQFWQKFWMNDMFKGYLSIWWKWIVRRMSIRKSLPHPHPSCWGKWCRQTQPSHVTRPPTPVPGCQPWQKSTTRKHER